MYYEISLSFESFEYDYTQSVSRRKAFETCDAQNDDVSSIKSILACIKKANEFYYHGAPFGPGYSKDASLEHAESL